MLAVVIRRELRRHVQHQNPAGLLARDSLDVEASHGGPHLLHEDLAVAARAAASIGSVGDAYDNALMESTIGLFKTELIKLRRPWKTLSGVKPVTAEYIDWYNHRRLHGEVGHVPPVEYENNHYLAITKVQVTSNV